MDWSALRSMATKKTSPSRLPRKLVHAQDQMNRWRETRERRTIPDSLWTQAVELAGEYGLHRTARALRLNYESLKVRIASLGKSSSDAPLSPSAAPVFVDLAPSPLSSAAVVEGVAEVIDECGARIRITWKGGSAPDLAAVSVAFFGSPS